MTLTLFYTIVGFALAGYSVIANDSIQTLGTFIASKQKWFKWYTLASAASFVMILAITWGWYSNDGDISYGRLTRIPFQEIQWYHAVAPGILLVLTRVGIPVSTTFLVLSAFASTVVLEKMLMKSVVGYGLAATAAYICWIVISKFINEKLDEVEDKWIGFWRNSVWVTSAWLWWVWLSHDVANIAVYLPRQIDVNLLLIVLAYFTALLFYIFYIHGGTIQKVVLEKTGTRYARSATIINIIYAAVLYYFKELNEGYGLAAVAAYICWIVVSKFINEKFDEVEDKWIGFWRNSVWVTSAWLWWVWLSHDVANIAVYLPRQIDVNLLLIVLAYFTALLFYIFYINGGTIQKVVLDKTGTRYARSATIINVIYAAVLYYFKELNDLPMSTTWVFVGLLCGRELAISTMNKDYKFKYVFPLIGKDFLKMTIGLTVSVAIVLAIHYIIIPNNWF